MLFLNKSGESWNSPFGVWDRAHRSGYTRYWCSRDPLDCRGTSNQTRAPWISRKGFLGRTGLLQLLTKNTHQNNNRESPPGGTHRQTIRRFACLVLLSQASGQPCPCNLRWEEVSCGFNLLWISAKETEIMIQACYLAPIWSLFTSSSSPWLERSLPKHHRAEGAKQPNLRPHSPMELGLPIQNIIPLSKSNLIP